MYRSLRLARTMLGLVAATTVVTAVTMTLTVTPAHAAERMKIMAPGTTGGGYDQTARTLGKALQEAGVASSVTYENKGGAGGTLGLAQFVNGSRGDGQALCVMGAIMVTGVVQNKPPITLADATPIARIFTEYNVIAVRKAAPQKALADLLDAFRKDPTSVKWGGGSKGSTDHIGLAMLAAAVGVPVDKLNFIPFGGGGEALSATLGGHVTALTGGYGELAKYIESGQLRVLAIGAPSRLDGLDAPTLKEAGIDVEIGNWRGVYGAAGITAAQRQALTEAVVGATKTPGWQKALKANAWIPSVITGDDFGRFVDDEQQRLGKALASVGLL